MFSQDQGQEAASPTLNVLRRLSRPIGRASSSSGTILNGVNASRAIVAADAVDPSPASSSKPTPFKRFKSQLGKRRTSSKEKGKSIERTPPQTPKISAIESIPQESDYTTSEIVSSQTTRSCDGGVDQAAEGDGSSLMEPGEHEITSPSADDDTQTMSPTTVARRIHALFSQLPVPYTLIPPGLRLSPQPLDQSGAAELANADSKLFSLLSSASAMNGSISKGRESVWAALERLRYSPHPHPKEERRIYGEANTSMSHDHEAEADNVDMSSVMVCCPLQPTENTEVEIARSEIVSLDFEETCHEPAPAEHPNEQGVGMIQWPLGKGKWKRKEVPETVPGAEKALPPPPPKKKEVRVWYPSRTKVSLQAFWWGYRIYLPPPVMRVLSDKTLEAAKRAAMITAALTWLVSHLPTTMLPPQMRAVVGIIKQTVPIMSYVGGFIAWSWKTIQGFDKGQGVTLSATWLLPIALVPGTWFYMEPPTTSPSSGEPSGT